MSEPFDPYYKWLGIPPHEQPASYYRLLSINAFESDAQVIEAAADRQMVFLRTFQTGQHVQLAQRLLNEVAQARVCLLNPEKKRAYDEQLRRLMTPTPPKAAPAAPFPQSVAAVPVAAPSGLPRATPLDAPQIVTAPARAVESQTTPASAHLPRSKPWWKQPAVWSVALSATLVLVLLGIWIGRGVQQSARNRPPASPAPQVQISVTPSESPSQGDNSVGSPAGTPTIVPSVGPAAPRTSTVGQGNGGAVEPLPPTPIQPSANVPQEDVAAALAGLRPAPISGNLTTIVCQHLDGRSPPQELEPFAAFLWHKPPSGIGLRGVVVRAGTAWRQLGTQWELEHERSFQWVHLHVVHPWKDGHLIVAMGEILRAAAGGDWKTMGLFLNRANVGLLPPPGVEPPVPMKVKQPIRVLSQLDGQGKYSLYLDGQLVATGQAPPSVSPLAFDHASQQVDPTQQPATSPVTLPAGQAALLFSDYKDASFIRGVRFGYAPPTTVASTAVPPNVTVTPESGSPTTPEPATPPATLESLTQRKPAPPADALQSAEEKIRSVFDEEFAKATSIDGKAELARTLFTQSDQMRGTPTEHYAILKLALTAACEAGDANVALQALAALTETYETKTALAVQALNELGGKVKTNEARTEVVNAALDHVEACIEQDDYDAATQLAALAAAQSARLRDTELRKTVKDQQDEIKLLQKQWQAASAAAEKLKENAEDPEANLVYGKYLCLIKDEWEQGLPLLLKCGDETLKAVAQRELAADKKPEDKVALADAWLDLAKSAPAAERGLYESRAEHWYEDALDEVTGLAKTQVERRLSELKQSNAAKPAVVRSKKGQPAPELGLIGRIIQDSGDTGLLVTYRPGTQLRDQTLKDALSRYAIKWRPVQIELAGIFTVPIGTTVWFQHNCIGPSDAGCRLYVDNRELSSVGANSNVTGTTNGKTLSAGIHQIRWTVGGRDAIGTCDLRIYYNNPVTNASVDVPIFHVLPRSMARKPKGQVDLSGN